MTLAVYDRVRETTTTTGTGTITLLGAVVGYQTFDVVGDGNTTYYTIAGQGTTEWEVGIGTFTLSGTTLARTTVLSNSLGTTAPVSFSAGTKDVFVTYPSEKAVYLDASGVVTIASSVLTTTDINGGTVDNTTIGATTASTGKFSTLTNAALTATRVTYAGTAGLLQDSANLTFNGTTLAAAGFSGPLTGAVTGNASTATALQTARTIFGQSFDGTANVTGSITSSSLTSGRVTYAGTGGLLQDDADLTFDGSTLTTLNAAYTGTLTGGTGVVNLGSGQFYKAVGGNVGIGTASPTVKLDVTGAGRFNSSSEALTIGASTLATNTAQYFRNTSGYGGLALTSAADQYFTGTVAGDFVIGTNAKSLRFGNLGTGDLGVTINASNNVGIGTSSPRTQAMILGNGQVTSALTDAGNTGGTLTLAATNNAVNGGGALLFAALNDNATYVPQWAIKSLLATGLANGAGTLAFSARASTSDTSLTECMNITQGGLLKFNSGYGSVANAYGCRAWVNFDGTGTVAIRGNANVSSVGDNNTGDYVVNFTTAMPDGGYSVSGSVTATGGGAFFINTDVNGAHATSNVRIQICNSVGVTVDRNNINVAVFR